MVDWLDLRTPKKRSEFRAAESAEATRLPRATLGRLGRARGARRERENRQWGDKQRHPPAQREAGMYALERLQTLGWEFISIKKTFRSIEEHGK
jgi:hypothetical protein